MQPEVCLLFIGSVPAGNAIISAAILFAGSFPLRIFKILNCHTVSRNTFFDIRHNYLMLAISSLKKQQGMFESRG